ncbi:hypothetical protein ISS30_06105 [bacterium]|nr:hypothetical protein [bacterium]
MWYVIVVSISCNRHHIELNPKPYFQSKPSCPCRRTTKYENSIKGEHMGSPLHSLIFVVSCVPA